MTDALALCLALLVGSFDASVDDFVKELKTKPPPMETICREVPWQEWRQSQNVEDRRRKKRKRASP